jgi:hypothetical protein
MPVHGDGNKGNMHYETGNALHENLFVTERAREQGTTLQTKRLVSFVEIHHYHRHHHLTQAKAHRAFVIQYLQSMILHLKLASF